MITPAVELPAEQVVAEMVEMIITPEPLQLPTQVVEAAVDQELAQQAAQAAPASSS